MPPPSYAHGRAAAPPLYFLYDVESIFLRRYRLISGDDALAHITRLPLLIAHFRVRGDDENAVTGAHRADAAYHDDIWRERSSAA